MDKDKIQRKILRNTIMEEARGLLLKHLYIQGGDALGISDGRVYNACLDAIMEALTIPVVVEPNSKLEMFQNMQYYMEYCQREGYIKPQDWLEKEKHS